MADFLLIHGACHGAWCWRYVVPLLEQLGHSATAIDLPGHGEDRTPVEEVTLESYARAIAEHCTGRTALVGHSMGGYAIAAAACLVPNKIGKLIYLCAYVPDEGASLAEMRMRAPTQPLLPAVRMGADGISFTIDPEMAADIFYNDCTDEVRKDAVPRLCPQATAPTSVPFHSTPEMRALPRHYIRCLNDHTIPPDFQVTMTAGWPPEDVQEMTCGHSPFFADPFGLAGCLDKAVRG
ncbi:MAG: alpha/beta fold hydrolase [Roseobacter sp.]|jgi:pimeloyl-ACP methyl ester carboxylesterase